MSQAERPLALVVDDLSIEYWIYVQESERAERPFVSRRRRVSIDALTDVSFSLHEGDAIGVIGHNGSGKTTLINAIGGSIAPSRGRVLVRSQPLSLGLGSTMMPKLTGRQNTHLGLLSLGYAPDEVASVAAEVIDFTGLGDFIDAPVKSYSAGMASRLKFAIATQREPDILLLDEALAVGDKRFKDKGLARINEIRERAGVIVLATHQPAEILETCTHALWLKDGHVGAFGDPEEVIEAYQADDGSSRNTMRRMGRRGNRR